MVQATTDSINTGVNANRNRGPTENTMFAGHNLLANIWMHLKPALAWSIQALYMILGNPELHLHQSPLSMENILRPHDHASELIS